MQCFHAYCDAVILKSAYFQCPALNLPQQLYKNLPDIEITESLPQGWVLGLFIVSLCAINLKENSPNDADYPAQRVESESSLWIWLKMTVSMYNFGDPSVKAQRVRYFNNISSSWKQKARFTEIICQTHYCFHNENNENLIHFKWTLKHLCKYSCWFPLRGCSDVSKVSYNWCLVWFFFDGAHKFVQYKNFKHRYSK